MKTSLVLITCLNYLYIVYVIKYVQSKKNFAFQTKTLTVKIYLMYMYNET